APCGTAAHHNDIVLKHHQAPYLKGIILRRKMSPMPFFAGYDPWRKDVSRRAHLPEKKPVRTNQVAVKQYVTLTG
ncbi:hypothetical protein, partial [Rhizobium johnstonii]|uniref:hypothetical protein n=1 Tax=Rhizobium johnstonii TaxID=3019933 RepID=UPI003F9D6DB7